MSRAAEILEEHLTGRVALMGVGNRWRGDDAAGPAVIDRVSGRVEAVCIDAGEAPERHLGEVVAGGPERIVLIDAVDFGSAPGEVGVFRPEELPGRRESTHDVSMATLMRYLRAMSGAKVILVGIQPGRAGFGEPMSAAVEAGVVALAEALAARLGLRPVTCRHPASASYSEAEKGA
jgi:hydrogenase maturation protease